MKYQELVVGHYEGSLTATEQSELEQVLATSPEARAYYENHAKVEEQLQDDSETIVPPIGLREATLAAALGTSAEVIGGGLGIGSWLTGKVAAVIGTVVVGGTIVGVAIGTSGGEDGGTPEKVQINPAPVELSISSDKSTEPILVEEDPLSTKIENSPSPTTSRENTSSPSAITSSSSQASSNHKDKANTNKQGDGGISSMEFNEGPDVTIEQSPTVQSDN